MRWLPSSPSTLRRFLLAGLAVLLFSVVSAPARAATALAPDFQKGANYTTWWNDTYSGSTSDQSLAALKATGSNSVEIMTTWYMASGTANTISPDSQKTPSDASILHAMQTARALGLRVVLKPHIDVNDNTFRGDIRPADSNAWFSSYRTFIDHYADLARQGSADMVVIGTELTTMSGYTAQWSSLIDDVRARFGGQLTFAANVMDGVHTAAFWGKLDYIGVDAYMSLSDSNPNPSVDDLVSAWQNRCYVSDLEAVSKQYGKPVMFTELGYLSKTGTAQTPWAWDTSGSVSQAAQQNAYEAAYRVWSGVPWFKGIYWWNWDAGSYNAGDGSFSPRGKAAEGTMKAWDTATAPTPTNVRECQPGGQGGSQGSATGTGTSGQASSAGTSGSGQSSSTSSAGRAVVVLKAKVTKVRHAAVRASSSVARVVLNGHVRKGSTPCNATAIEVTLERYDKKHHHWTVAAKRRVTTSAAAAFGLSLNKVRSGRYRAMAVVRGASCGQGRSSRIYFHVA